MVLRIPFGEKDGRLYDPIGVDRGKACGCVCPECRRPLVAKHGAKNVAHFAHIGNACGGGRETAIHKAAKQVLLERRCLRVPGIRRSYQEGFPQLGFLWPALWRGEAGIPAATIMFESIELEKRIPGSESGHIADALCEVLGKTLGIEIAVTHFSAPEKPKAYEQAGIAALEIDLSDWPTGSTLEDLAYRLANIESDRKWLFNPRWREVWEAAGDRTVIEQLPLTNEILRDRENRAIAEYIGMSFIKRKDFLLDQFGFADGSDCSGKVVLVDDGKGLTEAELLVLLLFVKDRQALEIGEKERAGYLQRLDPLLNRILFDAALIRFQRAGLVERAMDRSGVFVVTKNATLKLALSSKKRA